MTPEARILSKTHSETDHWLIEFGRRHRDVDLLGVYWLSLLAIIPGTVGILWSLPVPVEFRDISPALNWGSALLLATVVYYFIISLPLAIGLVPLVLAIAGFHFWLQVSPYSASHASLGLFSAGLAGLIVSRFRRAGFGAVFTDVQSMMIAPAWLLSRLYHKIGIPH